MVQSSDVKRKTLVIADREYTIDLSDFKFDNEELVHRILQRVKSTIEDDFHQQIGHKLDLIRNMYRYEISDQLRGEMEQMGFDPDKMRDPEEFTAAMHTILEQTYDDDYDNPDLIYDLSNRTDPAPYISIDYTIDHERALAQYKCDIETYRSLSMLGVTYEQWLEHKKKAALNRDLNF